MKAVHRTATVILLAAALGGGCGGERAPGPAPASHAAPGPLVAVNGEQVGDRVRAATNAVTMVHLWATWCPPCVREFPHIVRLRRQYHGEGLAVILISLDNVERREAVAAYLAEHGVDWETYIGTNVTAAFVENISPAWSGAIPTSLFYGPGGALLEAWEGARSYDEHEQLVTSLLKAETTTNRLTRAGDESG